MTVTRDCLFLSWVLPLNVAPFHFHCGFVTLHMTDTPLRERRVEECLPPCLVVCLFAYSTRYHRCGSCFGGDFNCTAGFEKKRLLIKSSIRGFCSQRESSVGTTPTVRMLQRTVIIIFSSSFDGPFNVAECPGKSKE